MGLASGGPVSAASEWVAPGIAIEGDDIVLEGPAGETRRALAGRRLPGRPAGALVGIMRQTGGRTEMDVLDRAGALVGTVPVPPGRTAVATDVNVITLPEAPHDPARAHLLGFVSLQGKTLREVDEPALSIVTSTAQPDGRMLTVNRGPAAAETTIVVYDARGEVTWRYTIAGDEVPDAVVTPDDRRLVVVDRRDLVARTAEVTLIGAGNRELGRHRLPNVYALATSSDSTRVAVAGQRVLALLDAESGALLWRRDEDVDLIVSGGLRFGPRGRLLVVAGSRDRAAGVLHVSLRELRLRDGRTRRTALGDWPLGHVPMVIDVRARAGGYAIVLNDRTLDVVPGGR